MTSPVISPVQGAQPRAGLMRQHTDDAKSNRYLSKEVAVAFAKNGQFKIGALRAWPGEESDPITQVQITERISIFDGPAG